MVMTGGGNLRYMDGNYNGYFYVCQLQIGNIYLILGKVGKKG